MVLVENNQLQANDRWQPMAEENPVIAENSIVSLAYWLENKAELADKQAQLGLAVSGDDDLSLLHDELQSFALICVNFPAFTDGRGFSLASMLRASGYRNDLRATGDFLPDQIFYLSRVGFNAFELADQAAADFALVKLKEFSVVSQPASDDREAFKQQL